jgi:hypothetical protein
MSFRIFKLILIFEQVLRHVRSKPKCNVSVLIVRSGMRATDCSSFELIHFSGVYGFFFECYQIFALRDAVHHRGKGTTTLGSSKRSLQGDSEGK